MEYNILESIDLNCALKKSVSESTYIIGIRACPCARVDIKIQNPKVLVYHLLIKVWYECFALRKDIRMTYWYLKLNMCKFIRYFLIVLLLCYTQAKKVVITQWKCVWFATSKYFLRGMRSYQNFLINHTPSFRIYELHSSSKKFAIRMLFGVKYKSSYSFWNNIISIEENNIS